MIDRNEKDNEREIEKEQSLHSAQYRDSLMSKYSESSNYTLNDNQQLKGGEKNLFETRQRHKKNVIRKKKTKELISHPSLKSNIIMNITIHYFFTKEIKYLELDNTEFIIKGLKQIDQSTTYPYINITSIKDEHKSRILYITVIRNNKDSNIQDYYKIEFEDAFRKYLFKSMAYQSLLTKLNRHQYSKKLELTCTSITWNINCIPVPNDLGLLFNQRKFENVDLLTIGVQECSMLKLKDWQNNLRTLMLHYEYECVQSVDMWQMFLMVFIKKELAVFVDNIDYDIKRMGKWNIIGNKGGMYVNFKLLGHSFFILNCHLAPKVFNVTERDNMIKRMIAYFKINKIDFQFDVYSDYTIWSGDLNYRIDFPFDNTIECLKQGDKLTILLDKDQLRKMQSLNKVFANYQEKEINFLPTYRRIKEKTYDTFLRQKEEEQQERNKEHRQKNQQNNNEDEEIETKKIEEEPVINEINNKEQDKIIESHIEKEEDNRKSKDKEKDKEDFNKNYGYSNKQDQSPSWCDRVLINTSRELNIISYQSLSEIRHSDHLPVESSYKVWLTIPCITNYDQSKYQEIVGKIILSNIVLCYDFNGLSAEFETIQSPLQIKLIANYELNEHMIESPFNEIESIDDLTDASMLENQSDPNKLKEIPFGNIELQLAPQLFYDLIHSKALNIFFKIIITQYGREVPIAFGKYCLEDIEKIGLSILSHKTNVEMFYLSRKLGVLSFKGDYEFDKKKENNIEIISL